MAKYVLFSARFAPLIGGVETYTANLAKALAKSGHQVTIVTCRLGCDPVHEVIDENIELYRMPASAPMGPRLPLAHKNKEAKEIYAHIANKGVDYVVINTRFYRLSRHGLQFAQDTGAPALVIDHGSAYLTMGNAFIDFFIRRYEHIVTRWVKRYKPLFAGVSRASADWLETFGIYTDIVIPNAIDVDAFKNQSSHRNYRREFEIRSDEHVYVAIGRLCPEKGANHLVDLVRANPEGHFFWAGEGSERSFIESAHLSNIHLLGNTCREDVAALLSQADVFFLPTRSEGFCTSLLEAASEGVPAVMPHVGGTDEVMGNPPRFGAIVPVSDINAYREAMFETAKQAHNNPDLHKEIEHHVQTSCSWDNTLQCLYNAFNN